MNYESGLDELAASVAHEIKNPLALIKAHVQFLELDDEKDHKKNYQIISTQIDKINDLLIEFMNLMKPQQYQWTKISLSELLDDVVNSIGVSLSQHSIQLNYNGINGESFIRGDYNKLKQVFLNILKNSIEAVEEDGEIRITSFHSEGYVVVKIEDNGLGISEKDLHKIGKPFFTTKPNGTGLGVSVSKRIIEEHKGIFVLSSMKGRGSTVGVTFPVWKEET